MLRRFILGDFNADAGNDNIKWRNTVKITNAFFEKRLQSYMGKHYFEICVTGFFSRSSSFMKNNMTDFEFIGAARTSSIN